MPPPAQFCDYSRQAELGGADFTARELAKLHAEIQSLPSSANKSKIIKRVRKI